MYSFGIKKGKFPCGWWCKPEKDLPTYLVSIKPGFVENLDVFRSVLLDTDPPIVGIIEDDYFMLDVRTLLKDDLPVIPNVLREAYKIICGD